MIEGHLHKQAIALCRLDQQPRTRQVGRNAAAGRQGKAGETFHHQRNRACVERTRIGQQQVARFTDETDALRNPRKQGHERRLE
jgi:hypothetical protein